MSNPIPLLGDPIEAWMRASHFWGSSTKMCLICGMLTSEYDAHPEPCPGLVDDDRRARQIDLACETLVAITKNERLPAEIRTQARAALEAMAKA